MRELREEIEPLVSAEGWTKNSIGKMWKLDSFLKECQRHYALGGGTSLSAPSALSTHTRRAVTMVRRAMKDFTFSDGTTVPEGTFVGVAVLATQHDPEYYDDPDAFRPERFLPPENAPDSSSFAFGFGRR